MAKKSSGGIGKASKASLTGGSGKLGPIKTTFKDAVLKK